MLDKGPGLFQDPQRALEWVLMGKRQDWERPWMRRRREPGREEWVVFWPLMVGCSKLQRMINSTLHHTNKPAPRDSFPHRRLNCMVAKKSQCSFWSDLPGFFFFFFKVVNDLSCPWLVRRLNWSGVLYCGTTLSLSGDNGLADGKVPEESFCNGRVKPWTRGHRKGSCL